jgi:hypothetical protein
LSADGTELPASYGITIPTGPEKAKIEGFVTVRDILGNQTRMDIADLYIMAMKDGRPDMQDTSEADKEPERKDRLPFHHLDDLTATISDGVIKVMPCIARYK